MIAVVFISFVCSSGLLSLSNYSSVCSVIRIKQKHFEEDSIETLFLCSYLSVTTCTVCLEGRSSPE